MPNQAPLGKEVDQEVHPCAAPLERGPPPRRELFATAGWGRGQSEEDPDRELEGNGLGGNGMEVAVRLTPEARGSPTGKARSPGPS